MSADRESWLRSLLAAAFPTPAPRPVYGSPEWLVLPPRSLQRLASAAVAGECWARDGDNLERRVRDELYFLHETWHDELDGCVIPFNPHLRQPNVGRLVARAEGAARALRGERAVEGYIPRMLP